MPKKKGSEGMSARERVYLRKQEKQAKEEQERLEALREAEFENRRIRQNAQQEYNRKIYGDNVSNLPGLQGNNPNNRSRSTDPHGDDETPRYEFDNRNRPKNRMEMDELNDRLEEATKGKGKYDDGMEKRNSGRGVPSSDGNKSSNSSTQINGEGSDSGSEEEFFQQAGGDADEEEEDLLRREEELKNELNFATLRVEELKRTLQETKSFLGPRLPTRGVKDTRVPAPVNNKVEEEEEDEDEDLYDVDEEYEVIFYFFSKTFLISLGIF